MGVYEFEQENGVKFIDGFELGDKAIASDPCYEYGLWCQLEIPNVSPGRYDAFVRMMGNRVAELLAVKQDGRYDFPTCPFGEAIGVDSGQAGIYDHDWYAEHGASAGLDCYSEISEMTLGYEYGTYDDKCVVSSSGWGDGAYQVFVDDPDDVQSICIVFMDDED